MEKVRHRRQKEKVELPRKQKKQTNSSEGMKLEIFVPEVIQIAPFVCP
jgi:hypothetical protein